MPNELIWLLMAIIDFLSLILAYKLFGKEGLYAAIAISIIICNIQVLKIVEIFGLTATLGNILYGSIFLATDILNEFYGRESARKGVWIGFYSLIFTTVIMQIALLFKPAPGDFIDPSLHQIFSYLPRIAIASVIAYIISQHHDVWLYNILHAKFKGKHLWIRNNLSTMVSQLIDTLIFCTVAFWGVFTTHILIEIIVTTYLFKWAVAVVDTPFIYLARRISGKSPGGNNPKLRDNYDSN